MEKRKQQTDTSGAPGSGAAVPAAMDAPGVAANAPETLSRNTLLLPEQAAEIRQMSDAQIERRKAEISTALNTATAEQMDGFEAELEALEARKKELAQAGIEARRAKMAAVLAGSGNVIAVSPERETRSQADRLKEVVSSEAYLNAYVRGIQNGDNKECRAMLTELVTNGSVPIPKYINNVISVSWEDSQILPRLNQVLFRGNGIFPFELSSSRATVHEEGTAAPTEGEVQIGSVQITPEMVTKWLPYSKETMSLGGQQFVDHVYVNVEHEVFTECEAKAIAAVKAAPSTATKAKASVNVLSVPVIDATTMFTALGMISSRVRNPVAVMHRQTYFKQFMSLMGTDGHPIYNMVSDNKGPSYFINGVEVLFTDALAAGTEFIVGDLSAITVNAPEGLALEFTTDPYSMAEKGMVKVVGGLLAGFGVTKDKHLVRVTVSAGGGS